MSIRTELCALKKKSGALLKVEAIHRWAEKNKDSKLYSALEWNNEKAGYEYRLIQISNLIRLHCVDTQGIRTLVSLSVDRVHGGGYRSTADVVNDKNLRECLLADALADLKRFEERYELLKELCTGIRKIRKKAEEKGGGKKAA